jgi:4-diphosphocytidyl-2-C-methyl-D-erythritol kinase
MSRITRRVTVRSLAKINLDLRVLHKRPDGFHELRTVFQTISLADTIEIEYQSARRTELAVDSSVDIPGNLILRAARAVLDAIGAHARVRFVLEKRIPLGGGLGGGSSNAAAMLLALPVLAGRAAPLKTLETIGAGLGSDVPFFLTGGTALGLGQGAEVYSLPDIAQEHILVISPDIHVATGPAYRALDLQRVRSLTFNTLSSSMNSFQAFVRALDEGRSAGVASALGGNDFEPAVFRQYPKLKKIKGRLREFGATEARMTGSGSAMFAIYRSKADRECAREVFEAERVFRDCRVMPAALVSRASYRRLWRRQLREHLNPGEMLWPPRSRYEE